MKRTFADKFSKFKFRFLIVLWLFIFISTVFYAAPVISIFISISKLEHSYFSIKVIDGKAIYSEEKTALANWVPISKISKRAQQAIIASEDGKFYLHPGYDLEQLRNAINESFVLKKKKLRGASTISQQLVKNLYLSKNKTFGRKIQELLLVIWLEKHTSKQKILETYLNIIEYGNGLYGIEKASRYYFNKSAASLTARESAFLAMLLPCPVKYAKSFKKKSLTPFAKRIVDSVLLKMRNAGDIGEKEYNNQLESHFSWEIIPIADDSGISEEELEDLNDN